MNNADDIAKELGAHAARICLLVDKVVAEQRTQIAGEPEKAIRLLALEQMAQYHDERARGWFRGGDTYEGEENRLFARKAREFADLIREGKHP